MLRTTRELICNKIQKSSPIWVIDRYDRCFMS